jgi:stage II sporulation protein D
MYIGLRRLSGAAVLKVKPLAAARLLDPATGRVIRKVAANRPLKVVADYASGQVLIQGPGLRVQRPRVALAGGLIQVGQRSRYPGRVDFRLGGTGLQLTNVLDIEQYLEGVLPGELPAGFGIEAQKALAVAARSYALVQRGKHAEYDLCDRTCCQMYLGHHRGSKRGLAAVRATRRQCLWSGEDLVYAFYSADCGCVSTRVEDVPLKDKPTEPLPYLTIVRDGPSAGEYYCGRSPYHRWTKRLTAQEVEARLNEEPETAVGRLLGVQVAAYDDSGRVKEVRLKGKTPATMAMAGFAAAPEVVEKVVTGWQFRNAVGPLTLKSTLFKVDQPEQDLYRFMGQGFGHGLGLCQIGANGMARRGFDYRQILAHYYPGTRIGTVGGE